MPHEKFGLGDKGIKWGHLRWRDKGGLLFPTMFGSILLSYGILEVIK